MCVFRKSELNARTVRVVARAGRDRAGVTDGDGDGDGDGDEAVGRDGRRRWEGIRGEWMRPRRVVGTHALWCV